MAGAPLASMKAGAKTFIDILAESTGGSQDGQMEAAAGSPSFSFASTATKDTQLITSVAALKAAVDSLTAAGSTNHADAFTKAGELFDPSSSAQKIIVLFHRRQDHHWSAACAGWRRPYATPALSFTALGSPALMESTWRLSMNGPRTRTASM